MHKLRGRHLRFAEVPLCEALAWNKHWCLHCQFELRGNFSRTAWSYPEIPCIIPMFSITVRDDTKKSRVVAAMLALLFASISLANLPYQGVRQFWQRTVTLESWLLHCQLNLVVV